MSFFTFCLAALPTQIDDDIQNDRGHRVPRIVDGDYLRFIFHVYHYLSMRL